MRVPICSDLMPGLAKAVAEMPGPISAARWLTAPLTHMHVPGMLRKPLQSIELHGLNHGHASTMKFSDALVARVNICARLGCRASLAHG